MLSKYKEANEILKKIERISQRKSASEVFRDIIDWGILLIGFNTKANIPESAGDILKNIQDFYAEGEIRQIHSVLMSMCRYVAETNEDLLGYIHMQLYPDKGKSQFFTPNTISEAMAMFTIDENIEKYEHVQTITDPAVGAGSLPLGYVRVAKKRCIPLKNLLFIVNDIDLFCCKMCALQLSWVGAVAHVNCLNTLTMEYNGYFIQTPAYTQIQNFKNVIENTPIEVIASQVR